MKNHKEILKQRVLKNGWRDAAEMVGGFDILYKHAFNNDYKEFLNLFNNLEVVQSDEEPNRVLYCFEPGENIMICYKRDGDIFINYDVIWSFFENGIGLKYGEIKYGEIKSIVKKWLDEVYNLRGVIPKRGFKLNVF